MHSRYKRQRILHFARMGYKPPTICRVLREEGLIANWMGIHKFLQKHRETNSIERRPGSGWPTKMMAAVKALVERQMRGDDETTTVQLHALLLHHGSEDSPQVSRCSGLDVQRQCLLPVDQNIVKHLQWAQEHLSEGVAATGQEGAAATGLEWFFIVLFSDESFCGRFIQRWIVLEPSVHFI